MRLRPCDLSRMGEHIFQSHSMMLHAQDSSYFVKRWVPMYLRQHRDITELLGDIHNDIFTQVNRHGVTFHDITRVDETRASLGGYLLRKGT